MKSATTTRPLALASLLLLLGATPARAQDAESPPAAAEGAEGEEAPADAGEGQPIPEFTIDPEDVVPQADAPVITLEELLARAEAEGGNLQLVELREQFEQANNQVRRAWAQLLPVAQAIGQYTRNSTEAVIEFPNFRAGLDPTTGVPNEFLEIPVQRQDQWAGILDVTMPVLVMPAYYGISAANLGNEAAQQNLVFARNELFFGITQAYYGAVASKRIIEVAAAQVEIAREAERVAKARYDVGEVPKVGYLRASVERSRFEQDLRRAQNAYVSSKLALATLAGIDQPFSVEAPPEVDAPQGTADQLVRVGLENRDDLQASRTSVAVAERLVAAEWWRYAPVITANGQYRWTNVAGFSGENSTWAITVSAIFTIFDYARYPDLDDARARLRSARATAENTAREVRQEVQTALLDLESARANLIKAQESVRLSEENAQLIRAQYDAGAGTYLDVVDASSTLFRARVAEVTESLNTQVAALRLSRAIGKFGVERFP